MRAIGGFLGDRRSHLPDRRPSGRTSTHYRNPGAAASAVGNLRRESSRNGAWRASACTAQLVIWCKYRSAPPPSKHTLWGRAAALRYDGGLHVTVVAHQMPHDFEQVRERLHSIDKIARGDHAPTHEIECLPDVGRRVMEAGLAGDLRVMHQRCVEADSAVVWTPAEEVYRAAAAQQTNCSLPYVWIADRLNGNIDATPLGQAANGA